MAFKSSQNHVRPHILYIIGKRMTSAMTMTMTKTPTKTNTKTKTMTKTLCLKDISYAIFSKSREFKDIKYDTYRVVNSSSGFIFAKIRAKYVHFFSKNLGIIQCFRKWNLVLRT